MALLEVNNVVIKGVAACVPKNVGNNCGSVVFATDEEAGKFIASTGIKQRRVVDEKTTTSDLCLIAAERLISELSWIKSEIDCLIFVTQPPDYILPATSCVLQSRLGLSEECYSIDISLGCSGWVYGMSVAANLISSGCFKKGLLLVGDTISKINSNQDKSTWPLFGDAGTATALEYDVRAEKMNYHFATDGSGCDTIIIPDGGYRNPVSVDSFAMKTVDTGIVRSDLDINLNGMDVFSFGISKAPQSVNKLLEHIGLDREKVDCFLFHQANKFMNEKIRKKLRLTEDQVPYSLEEFGNTSSATIPLTMVTQIREQLRTKHLSLVGCGFGVGLSWGSVSCATDTICVPELIEI